MAQTPKDSNESGTQQEENLIDKCVAMTSGVLAAIEGISNLTGMEGESKLSAMHTFLFDWLEQNPIEDKVKRYTVLAILFSKYVYSIKSVYMDIIRKNFSVIENGKRILPSLGSQLKYKTERFNQYFGKLSDDALEKEDPSLDENLKALQSIYLISTILGTDYIESRGINIPNMIASSNLIGESIDEDDNDYIQDRKCFLVRTLKDNIYRALQIISVPIYCPVDPDYNIQIADFPHLDKLNVSIVTQLLLWLEENESAVIGSLPDSIEG